MVEVCFSHAIDTTQVQCTKADWASW